MFFKNNVNDMIIKINQNEKRKIDDWSKSQNISSEQTNRTDPPPPQAHTEQVNDIFTKSRKSDDSPKTQKDPPSPIIINNKIKKDKPIKTSKRDYHMVKTKEYPFRNQKGSGVRRGVKEKDLSRNKNNTSSGIGVSMNSEDTMNDGTPVGVASTVQEGVTPSVVDMTVKMEKKYSFKSSYANVTSKPYKKKLNFHTLFTQRGNGIDVVVPVKSICAISERFANRAYGFFLGKQVAHPVVANYKWHLDVNLLKKDVSTIPIRVELHGVSVTAFSEDGLSAIATKLGYARAMIELRADVELKDNIMLHMPKISREGHYTCNVRVDYEWKPPTCTSCKVFGHIHEECPKNIGAGVTKTMKKPCQTS
uniref:DUF4283 domain-containing protein n=1 Tax=Tanacetum cinerariifolium TaxID=118510 RepID=A0A6L2KD56_TANCI|nr:hypothetical protein [Tanacetum cinerariifolium]